MTKIVDKGLEQYRKDIITQTNKSWFWVVCLILTLWVGQTILTAKQPQPKQDYKLTGKWEVMKVEGGDIIYKFIPNK